ncbi:MAG: hypothetical protein EXR75_06045 [Myxococcales bacterium]|nr:hypothetical protein [Myxococcales bacterium]
MSGARETEVVFWDRGGAPGPGYEQNLLTITRIGDGWNAVYTKVRWDRQRPPYRSDEYSAVVPEAEAASLLGLLERALEETYAEETDTATGDETKLTLKLGAREKTFFARWPQALAELRERMEALMARCQAEGTHREPPR